MSISNDKSLNRRGFLQAAALGAATSGILIGCKPTTIASRQPILPKVEGFEMASYDPEDYVGYEPVSDRKIKVGIVGYGVCRFGALFEFQSHPNVEVVAVSDLFPDRCETLAKETGCSKTYPSLEEMVKDDSIEAIFLATDAPSHARHAILTLEHGKHVATAVPAVFGSLEDADKLYETVKRTGLKYMMFETSCYHADNHAMREIYKAGGFGKIVYAEGEYFGGPSSPPDYQAKEAKLGSYKGWRRCMPPQWYITHATAYYVGVTGGSFTEVSCLGGPTLYERYTLKDQTYNPYNNPFATEIAFMRTNEGGMARMGKSNDTPGYGGEAGRIRGQFGSWYGGDKGKYVGHMKNLPDLKRPPLPPGVNAGGHGRSHGRLMNEFVRSILQDRQPLVDISRALNMTVCGVVAHQSALRDGELLKIPQYEPLSV
jgi:predicted dehydrogenase